MSDSHCISTTAAILNHETLRILSKSSTKLVVIQTQLGTPNTIKRGSYASSTACLRNKVSVFHLADKRSHKFSVSGSTVLHHTFSVRILCRQSISSTHFAPSLPKQISPIVITSVPVLNRCSNLNTSESFGPDGLSPSIFKMLTLVIAQPLATLFSISLSSGRIPDDYCRTVKGSLVKNDSSVEAYKYHLISLTSIVCKLFEKIVKDAIVGHLHK